MLEVTVQISEIDYEETLRRLYPSLSGKILSLRSKRMVVRLFQQLGDKALPILTDLLRRLSEDTKAELLVLALNAYGPMLTDKLNRELSRDKWGRNIHAGAVTVERGPSILLTVGQVEVDYPALLKSERISSALDAHLGRLSPLAKSAAGMAVLLAPETIERKGLELLRQERCQDRLMQMLHSALDQHGIRLTLSELHITQTDRKTQTVKGSNTEIVLTEQMESEIITALAGYLRDHSGD